jgi:hypothetical protein
MSGVQRIERAAKPIRTARKQRKTITTKRIMKTLLIAALAATGFTFATPSAEAGHYRCTTTYRAPYRVNTFVLNRWSQCQVGYDAWGRAFQYRVTVVTYRDVYSNGQTRTYNVTYRS